MFVLCLCSYFYDIIYLKYLRLIRAPAYSAKEPFKFFFGGFARVRLSSATVHVTSNFLNLSVDHDRHYIFQFEFGLSSIPLYSAQLVRKH